MTIEELLKASPGLEITFTYIPRQQQYSVRVDTMTCLGDTLSEAVKAMHTRMEQKLDAREAWLSGDRS